MARERTRATGLRRVLRWTARIVLGLFAFAVFATAVVIGAIHTEWGRTKIKNEIVAELQAEFPGSSIRALEGSPFGTLVLRGVTVNGRDGKPMVTIERLAVDAALTPLVRKTVKVNSVRIDGVAVFVREQPPEPPRAPSAPSGPSEPSAWTVEVPSIEIHNGRVVVDMDGGDAETLDKLFVNGGVWLRPGSPLAAIVSAKAMWRGKPVSAFAAVTADDNVDIPLATLGVGDARVAAYGATVTTSPAITGMLAGSVPKDFVPGIEYPVELVADAQPGGNIAVRGSYGIAQLDAQLVADLDKLTARGLATVTAPDLAVLTEGAAVGAGTAVIAFDADGTAQRARGIASAVATLDDMPPAYAVATFDATPERVEIVGGGETQGITARATATLEARADDWHLAASDVDAHARRFDDVRGDVRVHATAHGPLTPEPAIALTGTVDGTSITRDGLRIGELRGRFSAKGLPARTTFTTHIAASQIASGATRVPMANLDAVATIADDDTITIALGNHEVRAGDGRTWTGSGGTVTITEPRIVVEGVRTGSGSSQITASAKLGRENEDLEARVSARNVALALADPTLRGEADADVRVAFVGGRWSGGGTVSLDNVAKTNDAPPLDVDVKLTLAGRRIELTADAKNDKLGTTSVAFAATGPRDITDVAAWQRLPRSAIDRASIALDIQAAPLGGTGHIAGDLVLTATDARGQINVSDVATKAGALGATLSIAPGANGRIETKVTAHVDGLPQVNGDAIVVLPARPFDPRAWQLLGRRALHEASVHVRAFSVDPALLAKLLDEEDVPYSATVDASLVVATGATSTTLTADITNIKGGPLRAPVDVHAVATTDAAGTRAEATATAGTLAIGFTASSPLTVDGAIAGRAPNAKVDAKLSVPTMAARDLLGLVGRTDVLSGNVGGTITIDGTMKAPAIRAQVFAEQVAIRPTGATSKKPPKLDRLDIDARWFAAERRAEFDIMGRESDNRLLKITGRGKPDDLESVAASIEAANFDLTPLAAFAPGQLRGARGTLNAALTIRGLDPESGDVRGMLQILDGRLPLSPELGTLRRATLDVQVIKQKIIAKLDGRAGTGGGSVKGTLTAQLEGGMPMSAKLDAKLVKLTPIGELQPQIDADITGDFVNEGARWTGRLIVSNGKVFVPPEAGNELLGAGKPGDLIFIDTMRGDEKKGRRAPEKPWLVMRIGIAKTDIEVDQQDVRVRAVAQGQLRVEVGDGVGMLGQITTERGTVDVLGRRYRLEQGLVDFDGLPDPRLEVRMVHDFKNLTLTVEILGRASDPYPRLTGDPGTYTQGQLLSFLAGAEPGNDDSQAQANQAVVSGGLTFLGSRIGRKLNKYVPIKFDSINYEAGTASSSRAVRFGVRVSEKTYLLWRQRLEARADENPGEVLLEYQISPNALFELTAGERAAGGDFLLRTRW